MTINSNSMQEHDFTLLLDGLQSITPELEEAIFKAGCDDATLSLRFGRLFLTFSRTASSLREAIVSAVLAINGCGFGLRVLRVDVCNLVTQSDIARKIGRSRQLVHQYMIGVRGPGGFPPPACNITENAPLWYWCEVAYWLWSNDLISQDVLQEAQEVAVVNSVLDLEHQRQIAPELTKEIMQSLCLCK
ncbi:MAG: hypothetical protein ACK46M_06590 [Planctomyces sp.]